MATPETREYIADISKKTRDISIGVAVCYFAVATEASYARVLIEGILEAGIVASAAQAVNCYFAEAE